MCSLNDSPKLAPNFEVFLERSEFEVLLTLLNLCEFPTPVKKCLILLLNKLLFGVGCSPLWFPGYPQSTQNPIPFLLIELLVLDYFGLLLNPLIHDLLPDILHLEIAICLKVFVGHLGLDQELGQAVPLDNRLHALGLFELLIVLAFLEEDCHVVVGRVCVFLVQVVH